MSRSNKSSSGGKATAVMLPSMLSYMRSFQCSDGHLYGVLDWAGSDPVPILPMLRSARGANAPDRAILDPADLKKKAKARDDQNQAYRPNTIYDHHHAILPPGRRFLEMRWSLRVLPNALVPAMCEESRHDYRIAGHDCKLSAADALRRLVEMLSPEDRLEMAGRYLWRITDGSVLWRNRIARECRTEIHLEDNRRIVFYPGQTVHATYPGIDVLRSWSEDPSIVNDLLEHLVSALFSKEGNLFLDIRTRVKAEAGAEVWPSQLLEKPSDSKENERTKRYFVTDADLDGRILQTAGLTFQKIANRIRRIDEWHGVEGIGAICVEHYGYEMSESVVYRKTNNIYHLMRRLLDGASPSREESLYLAAMLIRGGTFVEKKEDSKKKADGQKGEDGQTDEEEVDQPEEGSA